MTVYRLPEGAVLLSGDAVRLLAYAVATAQASRRRNGLPPVAALDALARDVLAASASGHTDGPDEPADEPDYMTTAEAAQELHTSTRTVRRHAAQLGGRKVGGTWMVDRLAVDEHKKGLTA